MISIIRYSSPLRQVWENFLSNSINGTFIHSRNFMEYHGKSFEDFSLLGYKDGVAICLLPAHKRGQEIYSHQGLTYGGIILKKGLDSQEIKELMQALISFLKKEGFHHLYISQVPNIYARVSQEKLIDLLHDTEPLQKNVIFNYVLPLPLRKNEKENNKRWKRIRNKNLGMEIREELIFEGFWEKVLVPNLWEKHRASPVHTVEEINGLAISNPGKIRQYNAYLHGELLAGTTLFVHETAVNAQYTASTEKGRKLRALDHLYFHLFERFADKQFFSLGTAHDSGTFKDKISLIHWKKSFGAKPYVNEHFKIGL